MDQQGKYELIRFEKEMCSQFNLKIVMTVSRRQSRNLLYTGKKFTWPIKK